jgi:NADH-quinone oxidoreductase subunit G
VKLTIDGKEIEAAKGQLVIDAAEHNGIYIPRFCYHHRMRPVGMCRQCIVEIDTGRGPAIQPSCMVECTDGMSVDTKSDVTKKAQEGILEFLLINHPLDCPVCDKGGECPLQDQAMSHGPGESRFVEEKRHYAKPIPVNDLILLDRERCILCDRCTRFAHEVAGDPLIRFIQRGNNVQVNTFPDHPFSSYFSGNTVQICPVGALTSSAYRFKARPWDLRSIESTCTSCSVGCRVTIDESRNRVLRYYGVDSDPVNWSWMCDKGRYDFEALHSEDRLTHPLVRASAEADLEPSGWAGAFARVAEAIKTGLGQNGPSGVGIIGGARLTNEAAYSWAKLARSVIGTDNVDAQLGDGLPASVLGLPRATIDEACAPGSTVVLLGPDAKEELPILYIRLRHAALNDGLRIVEISPTDTGLTKLAAESLRVRPGEEADLVRALVAGGEAPEGIDADTLQRAQRLLQAGQVTVVLGRPSAAESAEPVMSAAATLNEALPAAKFLPALRRANVVGALELGLTPGLLPGRVPLDDAGRAWYAKAWGVAERELPSAPGMDATAILEAAADGKIDTLILVGADPLDDAVDADLAARALTWARTVIVVDTFLTESAKHADIVLPAAGYAAEGGTTTNLEGRITAVNQIVTHPGTARADWIIAAELALSLGGDLGVDSPVAIWEEIERVSPLHAGITAGLLLANPDGVVAPLPDVREQATERDDVAENVAEGDETAEGEDVAESDQSDEVAGSDESEDDDTLPAPAPLAMPTPAGFTAPTPFHAPPRDAYSLRLVATRKLYDHGTLVQKSPSLAHLAAADTVRMNPAELERLGVESGAALKISSAKAAVTSPVVADAGVPRGIVATLFDRDSVGRRLIDHGAPVTDVRVETTS